MKNKFELGIIEADEIGKKGVLYLLNNAGKAIALITLLVSTLVTFTDIAFADFSAKSFTWKTYGCSI